METWNAVLPIVVDCYLRNVHCF